MGAYALKILHKTLDTTVYIEGDYVVSPEKEQQLLSDYRKQLADSKASEEDLYHIDIPFCLETQKKLILEARFTRVDLLWQENEAAILVAHSG